jgi:uncharacterized membrane protein YvbJ
MYCPKCSQQQISDEMRFCSRCGFPLGAVKELIANDGAELQGAGVLHASEGCAKAHG